MKNKIQSNLAKSLTQLLTGLVLLSASQAFSNSVIECSEVIIPCQLYYDQIYVFQADKSVACLGKNRAGESLISHDAFATLNKQVIPLNDADICRFNTKVTYAYDSGFVSNACADAVKKHFAFMQQNSIKLTCEKNVEVDENPEADKTSK